MIANRRVAWFCAAVIATFAAPSLACEPTHPTPRLLPEVAAERVRNHQVEMWERSDAVFLSEANAVERIALPGGEGVSATLIPALALKGDLPTEGLDIRHSTVTSCGPIPFLDALTGTQGDWFVTYVRHLPSGPSVDATVPIASLMDPEALRAWRKAYPVSTLRSAD